MPERSRNLPCWTLSYCDEVNHMTVKQHSPTSKTVHAVKIHMQLDYYLHQVLCSNDPHIHCHHLAVCMEFLFVLPVTTATAIISTSALFEVVRISQITRHLKTLLNHIIDSAVCCCCNVISRSSWSTKFQFKGLLCIQNLSISSFHCVC